MKRFVVCGASVLALVVAGCLLLLCPPARPPMPPSAEQPRPSRSEADQILQASGGGLVSVRGERLPLRSLISEISRAAHLDFKVDESVIGHVDLEYVNHPARLALAEIVREQPVAIERRPDGFHIVPREAATNTVEFREAAAELMANDFEKGTAIFRPKDPKDIEAIVADLRAGTSGRIVVEHIDRRIGAVKLSFPKVEPVMKVVAALMRDKRVELPEADYRAYALGFVPNDPSYGSQWHLQMMNCPEAWEVTTGAPSVVIAIVDTGIDYDHPDLFGGGTHVMSGYDFVNDDNDAMDDQGHGTHCAGIAAGVGDNGTGICGVAFGCTLMPVKVLSATGGGSYWNVAQGIMYAADNGADIISLSLGGSVESGTINAAVAYAVSQGCVVVAASGNDRSPYRSWPACSPGAISVGATDEYDDHAWFSNFNQAVEVSAPGVAIYSTIWDDSYRYASGTSMATPCVAGVAALIKSAFPAMTAQDVRERLWISTNSDDWSPQFGYGRIDAAKAVGAPSGYVRAKISQPDDKWIFGRSLEVRGSVISDDLDRFEIEWSEDGSSYFSTGLTLTGGGTSEVREGLLAAWDSTSLANGEYRLRLRAFTNGGKFTTTEITVNVHNGLLPGWPQFTYIDIGGGQRSALVSDIDNDGSNEVIMAAFGICYVWNADGTMKDGWPQYGIANVPGIGDFDNWAMHLTPVDPTPCGPWFPASARLDGLTVGLDGNRQS